MSKFKPTNIKGGCDSIPSEQILRNRVIDVLKKNFESYGFAPIETSSLNYLEMLTHKYERDAEIVREIYKIRDQGDRDLGLRFDLTVPFAKFIATNRNIRMPFRRYEIGKVWRNGPVKAGRLREFYQCDIDVVGITGQAVEAEIIALGIKCFLDLGITPVVKYNNRLGLVKQLSVGSYKIAEHDIDKVISIIDRIEKDSRDDIIKQLEKFMPRTNATALLDSFKNPTKHPEIVELEKELKEYGVLQYCEFSPSLARGLNYYTGTIWEVYDKAGRISSSLGGGGRYDNMVTEWVDNGLHYPSVGMAFGLEPIMVLLEKSNTKTSIVDIMIVPMVQSDIQDKLRKTGVRVLTWHGDKVGKAFEYADKENIPYVTVIGEREISGGKIKIKNMKTGEEREFNTIDISKILGYITHYE